MRAELWRGGQRRPGDAAREDSRAMAADPVLSGSAQLLGGEDASRTRRVAAGGMSVRSSLPQLPSNGHNVRVRLELGTWARKNRNEIK